MGEESTEGISEGSDKEDQERDQETNSGRSRYARGSTDSSIAGWLASKEKGQVKPARKGLGRGKGLVSRKGLNPVSKKQKKKNSSYQQATTEHFKDEANQKCFLCGSTEALSIHHRRKRGKHIDDPFYFMTLCMIGDYLDKQYPDMNHSHSGGCHGFVEGNKEWAREKGYIV